MKHNDPKSKCIDYELVRYLGQRAWAGLGRILGRVVATLSGYIGSTLSLSNNHFGGIDLDSFVLE